MWETVGNIIQKLAACLGSFPLNFRNNWSWWLIKLINRIIEWAVELFQQRVRNQFADSDPKHTHTAHTAENWPLSCFLFSVQFVEDYLLRSTLARFNSFSFYQWPTAIGIFQFHHFYAQHTKFAMSLSYYRAWIIVISAFVHRKCYFVWMKNDRPQSQRNNRNEWH